MNEGFLKISEEKIRLIEALGASHASMYIELMQKKSPQSLELENGKIVINQEVAFDILRGVKEKHYFNSTEMAFYTMALAESVEKLLKK